ncbi:MAG TPA: TatD family hydrolase [Myxococcales bacterium]|nr:TatD family hydrolase [Myxococcales bacterium]
MTLIDSHCHIDGSEYDADRGEVVTRARAAGLRKLIVIGLWRAPGDFGRALEVACDQAGFAFPTVGVHPHDCARVPEADWEKLAELVARPDVVGVGETGLDYHYDHSPREAQRAAFERQLQLAAAVGKPATVHLREAHADCLAILRASGIGSGPGAVVHCFSEDRQAAEDYLALGLYLSISGIVTFKTAGSLREAVAAIPLDRLLVETDSPWLTPVPFRGQRNEPAHVSLVAQKIGEVKGLAPEEIAQRSAANAERLFRLEG